jgi:tRNA(adenine34) deaminase
MSNMHGRTPKGQPSLKLPGMMDARATDTFFMKEALKEAQAAEARGEIPIGAVVVANLSIIARAHNQVELLQDPTAHAEMVALTAAANHFKSKYLTQCTLYVTLEPCVMCSGALYWAQLHRLVFGARDPKRGYQTCATALLHPRTEVVPSVLEEPSSVLLTDFFRRRRNLIL